MVRELRGVRKIGRLCSSALDLSSLNGSTGFRLDGIDESLTNPAMSVSNAGDVNGDGFDDLIIGAIWGDAEWLLTAVRATSYLGSRAVSHRP